MAQSHSLTDPPLGYPRHNPIPCLQQLPLSCFDILILFQKRRVVAEANRSVDHLRCPVICVLGHVDTGKTKILDKVSRNSLNLLIYA